MSLCNRCTLTDIERRAAARGAVVKVTREPLSTALKAGSGTSWYIVKESDHDAPCAYFAQLTVGCAC